MGLSRIPRRPRILRQVPVASDRQLHWRRQRETACPLRQSLVECGKSRSTRTARQVQRISKIETLVERFDRHPDGVAIFQRHVLDARQRPQRNTRETSLFGSSWNLRRTHSDSSSTVTERNDRSLSAATAAGRFSAACASSGSSTKNRARTFVSRALMACYAATGSAARQGRNPPCDVGRRVLAP